MKKTKFFGFIGVFALAFASLPFAISCGGTQQNENDFIEYSKTDTNIRLKNDYKKADGTSKDFFTQGIGEVTPVYYIDGDTTHFRLNDSTNKTLIKARYYGVDTPESTGAVEPYGKAAANFTKEKISNAFENGTVVISSLNIEADAAPSVDSNGRYLTMVWINETVKDAPYDELYLLNLMLVENGYSQVKNLDDFPEFKDTFLDAETQARNHKLVMFSGKDDPDYNYGDYEVVSLLDLKHEVIKTLEDKNYVNKYENKRVRVRGTVAGWTNNILYLQQAFEDEDTGEIEYGAINIFTSMTSIPTKYRTKNTVLEISGLAQTSENFGFQLTDVYSWPVRTGTDPNDTMILYTPEDIPEDYKIDALKVSAFELDANTDYLFTWVELEQDIFIYDGYDSNDTPHKVTLNGKVGGESGREIPLNIYVPFLYTPDASNPNQKYTTYEDYLGKTFHVSGIYSFHNQMDGDISYQVVLRDSNDLVLRG